MAIISNPVQIQKLRLQRDQLDGPAQDAFRDSETRDLQFGIDWLSNLAATALDRGEEAVIYIARRSATDFVACPMKVNRRKGYAHSLTTFYSSTYSPIIVSDTPETLLHALFCHLAMVERIASLVITPMDDSAPTFSLLRDALAKTYWKGIHTFFCFGNWIHITSRESYQSYLLARPSTLKNTIARRTRQFLGENRGRLEVVTGGDQLGLAIEAFVSVYNASWKQSEPYPDFIPRLLRLSAERGWLRLGIASYDNKPIASQIWLVWAGTAQIFKLAYHQDYSRLSPGTVLTAHMMEYVIDKDSVSKIDFLSGDDDYKRDWMSTRGEKHGLAAYNVGTLRGLGNLLGHIGKNLARSLRGKPQPAQSRHGLTVAE